jgi:hypothetical protein
MNVGFEGLKECLKRVPPDRNHLSVWDDVFDSHPPVEGCRSLDTDLAQEHP